MYQRLRDDNQFDGNAFEQFIKEFRDELLALDEADWQFDSFIYDAYRKYPVEVISAMAHVYLENDKKKADEVIAYAEGLPGKESLEFFVHSKEWYLQYVALAAIEEDQETHGPQNEKYA